MTAEKCPAYTIDKMAARKRAEEPVTLHELACRYVAVIERIERTSDRAELQGLEEERVICHNRFADALTAQGILHKDRDHVTRIAFRLAKDEL